MPTTRFGKTTVNREQWQRLKGILDEAFREKTAAARGQVVRKLCADNAALLREAESLLAEAERMFQQTRDDIEEGAEQATALRGAAPSADGRRLGAYRLVRELARGGMGAVHLAERADGRFEKQVAIKIIKRGTDTEEVLRRFETEGQILARLEHPNIARLLDAGMTDDALPYFVMEYVAGAPVTRFVRERKLPIRERLELFLKICAAVEVAHQARVIHRDIKPSNILVNEAGEPKLLDFGIAKLLTPEANRADVTVTAQQILTPTCASPEQVRGERITVVSDIYALGALLYELLSDQPPHRFSVEPPSPNELMRIVCETDPPPPSALARPDARRELRGDLDKVTLCAMRKDPAARYSSVADFAADIRRYLEGEPVQARHRTVAYRVERFVRRNRVAVLAAAAFLALAVTAYLLVDHGARRTPSQAAVAERATLDKSIAVLPFRNLGDSDEGALFAIAVQDQILSDLAKVSGLKVIGRTSVEKYRAGQAHNLREIGAQLGVGYVLQGSVQREDQRVRVSVQLLEAQTDAQVWAEHYDRDLVDVFAIQSGIAQAVAAQLKVKLLPAEKQGIKEPPTRDLVAYELYLRAKESVNGYLDASQPGDSLRQAIRLLDEATTRDPNFMLAYCYAARAHSLLFGLRLDFNPARPKLAENAARAALHLQPGSAEAHLALADFYYRCGRGFTHVERELEIARPGLPNSPRFEFLDGSIHRRRGRWEQSNESFQKAVALDPRNIAGVNLLADNHVLLRRYGDAVRTYQNAIAAGLDASILKLRIATAEFAATGDLDRLSAALAEAPPELDIAGGETPQRILVALAGQNYDEATRVLAASPRQEFQEVDLTYYFPRAWYEAVIARARGDGAGATEAFAATRVILEQRLKNQPRDARSIAVLAQVDAALGDKALAMEEGRTAVERLSQDAYDGAIARQNLSQVYAWTGEPDLAFELLQQLVREPGYVSYGHLRFDPGWAPLRQDRRFDAALEFLRRGVSATVETQLRKP